MADEEGLDTVVSSENVRRPQGHPYAGHAAKVEGL
jgi:hypothetical protein